MKTLKYGGKFEMDAIEIRKKVEEIIPKMQVVEEAGKAILLLNKIDKNKKEKTNAGERF